MSGSLKITAVSCGAMGLLALCYQVAIIAARNSEKILIGSGTNKNMEMMMRGHANLMENAPLAMVTLLVAELQGYASQNALAIAASTFVVGRVLHAYAFLGKMKTAEHLRYRPLGMMLSIASNVYLIGIVTYNGVKEFY